MTPQTPNPTLYGDANTSTGTTMTNDEEPRSAGLEQTVRAYLNGRTDSGYAIAKKAGISRQQFYRFVRGERGLTLDSLDKLCFVLGLALMPIHGTGISNDKDRNAREEVSRAQLEAKREEFPKKAEARRKPKGKTE